MNDRSDETFSLEEVFEAYHCCRRHKRNKASALAFEVDLESNLIALWQELNSEAWKPGPAAVFIVEKPVKREIFAAGFRDRVVHHVLINRLNPYFEKTFIYDSYSCRVGKGTHFGIGRVKRFIRQCSENYARDAWCSCLESATGSRVSASLNCIQGKSGCSATRGECPFSAASSSPAACIRGPGCKRISHLQSNFKTLWFKRSHRVGLKPMPFAPL